jgi:hypothetical protein
VLARTNPSTRPIRAVLRLLTVFSPFSARNSAVRRKVLGVPLLCSKRGCRMKQCEAAESVKSHLAF